MEYNGARYAIELEDIWFSYHAKDHILKGISLSIEPSSSVALVGPNGSGKTTLLKIISGLLEPKRGSVRIFGNDIIGDAKKRMARRGIGYIPQQLGLIRNSTVIKNVLIGALSRMNPASALIGIYPGYEIEYARSCIDWVGLSHKINEKVHRLSGGERQRVAIARALMQKPAIILADEFTSDLDYMAAEVVMNLMSEVKKQGLTVVMAMHNLELAVKYSERIVCLKGGMKVTEMKAPELTEENIRRIYT